jgi:hypothetical protein
MSEKKAETKTNAGQPPLDNDHVAPGCEPFTPAVVAINERWETGRGDGAGVYLATNPAARHRVGDFGEGGKEGSAMAHARATLAATAPEMLRVALDLLAAFYAYRDTFPDSDSEDNVRLAARAEEIIDRAQGRAARS